MQLKSIYRQTFNLIVGHILKAPTVNFNTTKITLSVTSWTDSEVSIPGLGIHGQSVWIKWLMGTVRYQIRPGWRLWLPAASHHVRFMLATGLLSFYTCLLHHGFPEPQDPEAHLGKLQSSCDTPTPRPHTATVQPWP